MHSLALHTPACTGYCLHQTNVTTAVLLSSLDIHATEIYPLPLPPAVTFFFPATLFANSALRSPFLCSVLLSTTAVVVPSLRVVARLSSLQSAALVGHLLSQYSGKSQVRRPHSPLRVSQLACPLSSWSSRCCTPTIPLASGRRLLTSKRRCENFHKCPAHVLCVMQSSGYGILLLYGVLRI